MREHFILDLAHVDDLAVGDCREGEGFFRADGELRRIGRRRCEKRLEALAYLRHGEADDDLERMSVTHEAVCARTGEDGDRLHEVGIFYRHAQARRAVRDVLDVRRAAESFEEDLRLHVALVELHIGCGACSGARSICLLRLVVGFREELVLDIVVRPARRLVILEADDSAEDEEVDGGEAQTDADLREVRRIVVGEKRNPVLHEAVDETAAEVARKPDGVERRRERRREDRMQQIKERRDEKEGEFQRLGDAAEHRRDRRRNQESRRLLALFRLGARVDGERRARQAEDLAAAVQREAALREEVAE